jgi:hypothetical protein
VPNVGVVADGPRAAVVCSPGRVVVVVPDRVAVERSVAGFVGAFAGEEPVPAG